MNYLRFGLALGIVVLTLLNGCDGTQTGTSCDDVDLNNRPVEQVGITAIDTTDHVMTIPGGESGFLQPYDAVPYSQYQLNVHTSFSQLSTTSKQHRSRSLLARLADVFVPQVHACVIAPIYQSSETVTGLTVTSDQDFDESHLAGDLLNDLFHIRYEDEQGDRQETTLADFIAANPRAPVSFTLILQSPPMSDSLHRFTIGYHLSDQDYTYTAQPIELRRGE